MPSRNEQYLEAAVNKSGTDGLPEPRTRNEKLLHRLVEEVSSGGLPEGGSPYQQLVTDGDGNTKWEERLAYDDSRVVVASPNGAKLVKVSDEIPSWASVDALIRVWSSDGTNDTVPPEGNMDLGNGSFMVIEGLVFFITTDNFEFHDFVFPEKGVYFLSANGKYITGIASADSDTPEITWDGNVETLKTIDPKYIKDMYYDNLQSASYDIYTGGLTEFPRSELDIPLEMWKLLLDENATITDETSGSVMTNRTVVGSAAGERVCYSTGIPGISSLFISTMYSQAYLVVSSAPDDRLGEKRTIKVSIGTIKQIDQKYIPPTTVIVNIIPNKDGTFSADKTYMEVKELIDNGVDVKCVLNDIVIPIAAIHDTSYVFVVESFLEDFVVQVNIYDGGCEVVTNSPGDAVSELIDAKLGVIENGSY